MRMIIAGGGTGGHLFPALALAEAVRARGGKVLLLGSGRQIERMALDRGPYPVKFLPTEGVAGRNFWGKARALAKLLWATWKALMILRTFEPQLVFGVGGYASLPSLLAARLRGVKAAIHEQNALPGRANLFLARLVHRIFVTFPSSASYFPRQKVVVSGMPIRGEVRREYPREHEGPGLLVTGGSQGARFLNKLFVSLAPELARVPGLYLIHQTGPRDYEWVQAAYRRAGLRAEVRPFITEMGWAYAQADLVVCRAGAATVAELCYLRKPAILVPYPFAINDHQAANAQFLVRAGGAVMWREEEIEPAPFKETLLNLLQDHRRLRAMARNLENLLPEDALAIILRETEALVAHA